MSAELILHRWLFLGDETFAWKHQYERNQQRCKRRNPSVTMATEYSCIPCIHVYMFHHALQATLSTAVSEYVHVEQRKKCKIIGDFESAGVSDEREKNREIARDRKG